MQRVKQHHSDVTLQMRDSSAVNKPCFLHQASGHWIRLPPIRRHNAHKIGGEQMASLQIQRRSVCVHTGRRLEFHTDSAWTCSTCRYHVVQQNPGGIKLPVSPGAVSIKVLFVLSWQPNTHTRLKLLFSSRHKLNPNTQAD